MTDHTDHAKRTDHAERRKREVVAGRVGQRPWGNVADSAEPRRLSSITGHEGQERRGSGADHARRRRLVLAFDTASDAIALAVGEIIASDELDASGKGHRVRLLCSGDTMARREANVRLVPAIEELFAQHGLSREDIACVVCGRGPGSFTGVRIAIATAKGLAAGLDVPLFGVVTLDAKAWQAWLGGVRGSLAVLSDAMRGEVYPARYTLDEQGVHREDPLSVVKAEALAERWRGLEDALVLTGDALYRYRELFSDYTWLDEYYWRPKGEGLLRAFDALLPDALAFGATPLAATTPFDALPESSGSIAALLPVYTRLSDAEENERRRLAEGGALAQGVLTDIPASGVAAPLHSEQSVFRPAAAGDIPPMAALEQSVYAHDNSILSGECWTESLYRADIGLPDRSWWVCYQGDMLAGFAGGQLLDGQMHVLDIVVSEPCRRQGIACGLLLRLARDAKDLGATEVTLEVRAGNTAAIALYSGLGLVEVGRREGYYTPLRSGGPREDALVMTCNVDTLLARATSQETTLGLAPAREPGSSCPGSRPLILAIESSCDETAAALIDGEGRLLENVVASQTDFHARFGGVVPEIASRKHTEAIYPVVMEALGGRSWQDLDAIAVTYAPGLIGALVVGVAFAKGLSWATGLPLIKVNHLEGHTYANRFVLRHCETEQGRAELGTSKRDAAQHASTGQSATELSAARGARADQSSSERNAARCVPTDRSAAKRSEAGPTVTESSATQYARTDHATSKHTHSFYQIDPLALRPPFIIALLSGGNTMLVHVLDWGSYEVLGETLDDAVGEAYDKVAKALGLGYPGGPVIARLAKEGDPEAIAFPRALLHSDDYQFSLSGLKTAVLTAIRKQAREGTLSIPDVAASFEQAVIDVQAAKALRACKSLGVRTFCIGGGVASNTALRDAYRKTMEPDGISLVFPPQVACTDNAAMIAAVAVDRYKQGKFSALSDDASAGADLQSEY